MLGVRSPKVKLARFFNYDPQDVCVAFAAVVFERYGEDSLGSTWSWSWQRLWRKDPQSFILVRTGRDSVAKGIRDWVGVKSKDFCGHFFICPPGHSEIHCVTRRYYQKEAEDFLDAVEKRLETKSIYRGRALTIYHEFLDFDVDHLETIVYNEKVLESLKANLWVLIEQPELCRKLGIRRQRKVLLEGPFGSGKTLTALLTAKKAVENGWTFIYSPPSDQWDNQALIATFKMARYYQPAVVFIEDIDHEQRLGDAYALKKILAAIDGIISKNDQIIVVMTVNQAAKIDPAIQRPGRIDKIIHLGFLDAKDVQRLIVSVVPAPLLDSAIDWKNVSSACLNYPPAFVREIATSALLLAVSREQEKVTEVLLIQSAKDLEDQFKACAKPLGFNPSE